MIVVLDNYDSFTYNLVQYLGELGGNPAVYRNDQVTVAEVEAMAPQAIVISPGPGIPERAGISVALIRALGPRTPFLGVCLGHQAIAVACGGRVRRADQLMHGKTSLVRHSGQGLFAGLPNPLTAMRYHSLVVAPEALPPELDVTARSGGATDGGEIMAVQHASWPVYGVQFHPESVGTEDGKRLIGNFLAAVAARR